MTSAHRRGVTASPAWVTPSLMMESAEINGARKLLCKLQQCFEFSMTPSVPMKCKSEVLNNELYENFPLPTKYRKLAGEAMMRFLLESKDNVRRWLYEDCELLAFYERDKNGKVVRINIKAE
jgi:hypothetical protein